MQLPRCSRTLTGGLSVRDDDITAMCVELPLSLHLLPQWPTRAANHPQDSNAKNMSAHMLSKDMARGWKQNHIGKIKVAPY